jgi:large subunit ribosomal protein L4e
MATARPTVSIYQFEDATKRESSSLKLPAVFTAPLRPDLVREVHTNMAKNKRQAYGVSRWAGHQTSAESWGTGRAVSRIPRVAGGGTHRAGQAAFGNMCRGGHMFNPNRTWRRWHRSTNVTQKRHAMASALAASALPSLVLARGHRIADIPELPLVVSEGAQSLLKTKAALKLLNELGCTAELQKVADSKTVRAGSGKSRGRRYVQRRGPLVVFSEDNGIVKAFRNIPGVELCHVDNLNLLQVAPGGTFGRFIIWTAPAFKRLRELFGTYKAAAPLKKGYRLLRASMTNADVAKIINSDEVQSALRPAKISTQRTTQKRNPLRNKQALDRLIPGASHRRALRTKAQTKAIAKKN